MTRIDLNKFPIDFAWLTIKCANVCANTKHAACHGRPKHISGPMRVQILTSQTRENPCRNKARGASKCKNLKSQEKW